MTTAVGRTRRGAARLNVGRIFGAPGSWSAACGACTSTYSLDRKPATKAEANASARREGWTYTDVWGWVCPTCRFSFGQPLQEPPRPAPGPRAVAPRRRVVMVRMIEDGRGTRKKAEYLECGHYVVPDGAHQAGAGNRVRRCPDCLREILEGRRKT